MARKSLLLLCLCIPAPGQMQMQMQTNEAGMFLMNEASGTSENPQSWQMPMFMPRLGSWNVMLMGQAFIADTQQSGPRAGDKLYSTNALMGMAEHAAGRGSFGFDLMLSLEPATITDRRYPELFQTGETAYGRPIVDGQHPHNFIMGLGFHYAHPVGEDTIVQLYYAPVGDPALGPVAYPHRASAAELPQATLGHHWQDSTHIAYNVVTAGIRHKKVQLEASGFYGTEPGENRWTLDFGPMNSWATRLSFFPSKNWELQMSTGRIAKPEREQPGDVMRSTASVMYSKPLGNSNWSTTLLWGRNHDTYTHHDLNSYLAESVLPFAGRNFLTGRIELVDKDELFADDPVEAAVARTAGATFRIRAYTAGYTRDIAQVFGVVETGIGANVTGYSLPSTIRPFYGNHPVGVTVYLRLRVKPSA
ncbi:MAG TPA: hypothetical protein VKU01_20540 [Bryobacteraceae bacterium]|nr:hypothetical protein [Bryobacteraceae bacterium]